MHFKLGRCVSRWVDTFQACQLQQKGTFCLKETFPDEKLEPCPH